MSRLVWTYRVTEFHIAESQRPADLDTARRSIQECGKPRDGRFVGRMAPGIPFPLGVGRTVSQKCLIGDQAS